jgi:hypothetical protein
MRPSPLARLPADLSNRDMGGLDHLVASLRRSLRFVVASPVPARSPLIRVGIGTPRWQLVNKISSAQKPAYGHLAEEGQQSCYASPAPVAPKPVHEKVGVRCGKSYCSRFV